MAEEKLIVDRRNGGNKKKLISYGVTAFIVIAAAVLLIFVFVRRDDFRDSVDKLGKAFAPIIVGCALAYCMNPILIPIERGIRALLVKKAKKIKRAENWARGISLFLTVIIVLAFIAFLCYMLIPELVNTVMGIVNEFPDMIENFSTWFNEISDPDTDLGYTINEIVNRGTASLEEFSKNGLLTTATNLLGSLATGIKNIFSFLYNVLVGMICAIYILASKEKMGANCKKLIFALFKRRRANRLLKVINQCHEKFIGSIVGKVVDSVIVGVICYVGMIIFDFPYAVLISVIIGVTNVIPFFGPWMGAIPSALLILFVSPVKCLWFALFILVLQQFDSNILTPLIVGDSVGLSHFWVLFACAVFGGLFSIIGMLLGVPVVACAYMLVKEYVDEKLKNKGLPQTTEEYMDIMSVDETEMITIEVVPPDEVKPAEVPEYRGPERRSR